MVHVDIYLCDFCHAYNAADWQSDLFWGALLWSMRNGDRYHCF